MPRHHRRGADTERGDITVFGAVLAVSMFVIIGLVIDGGRYITAAQHADTAAAEAARAAGQHITGAAVQGYPPQVQVNKAVDAAQDYLNAAGVTGTVTVAGDTITVTTTATESPVLLTLAGVGTIQATGSATVRLAGE